MKVSDAQCLENYAKVCNLFRDAVEDAGRFTIVYGCGVDVGIPDEGEGRKPAYTYVSYAVGYDPDAKELAVLPIDGDLVHHGEVMRLKRTELSKARMSPLSREITIRDKRPLKKLLQFTVPEHINRDLEGICVCVKQNEQAKAFQNFFKKQLRK